MRQEVRRTQLCHLVMVDHLGESGTRAAWNQRALPSGVVVFWGAVHRTQVRWAIHRPRLSLVQSQLRVKQSLVKVKASQLLHTQSVQRRRTLHRKAMDGCPSLSGTCLLPLRDSGSTSRGQCRDWMEAWCKKSANSWKQISNEQVSAGQRRSPNLHCREVSCHHEFDDGSDGERPSKGVGPASPVHQSTSYTPNYLTLVREVRAL